MLFVLRWLLMIAGGVGIAQVLFKRRNDTTYPHPSSLITVPNTPVAVSRVNDGGIAVHWTIKAHEVKIYVGYSFATIGETPVVTATGVQEVVIPNLQASYRYYFKLVFDDREERLVAERTLPFNSIANFRDIGGYPTRDGRTTKWDTLYRSAALAYVTPDEQKKLTEMGISTVCDMRSHEEVQAAQDKLPEDLTYLHLPAQSNYSRWGQMTRLFLEADYFERLLPDFYTQVMIDNNPQVFATIFNRLADADGLPALIHCTAGKDRTGLAIALVLITLGVPEEIVLADYTLTNAHYDYIERTTQKMIQQFAVLGVTKEAIVPALLADARTMERTLQHIRTKYGSVENYVRDTCRIDETIVEKLKDNLLQ